MRLHITNDKNALVEMICHYLSLLLVGRKVDLIINGSKFTGTVKKISLENDEDSYLVVTVDKQTKKIPLLDETKARFGNDLVVLETKAHTTVIEVLD